jgi:hypothetical protein
MKRLFLSTAFAFAALAAFAVENAPLAVGQTIHALLSGASTVTSGGQRQDTYSLALSKGQRVRIDYETKAFGGVLVVRMPGSRQRVSRDGHLIITAPVAGIYTVVATNDSSSEKGAYTLSVKDLGTAVSSTGTVAAGQTLNGTLVSAGAGGQPAQYKIILAAMQVVSINLASDDFEAVLTAISPSGQTEPNDISDARSNMSIWAKTPGTYILSVSAVVTADRPDEGNFKITVTANKASQVESTNHRNSDFSDVLVQE